MLKVYINDLEIDFDGTIPIRLLNPLFNDQVTHSFNLKTVLTSRNKDVINQLHLPETGINLIRMPAMIVTDSFALIGAVYFTSVHGRFMDFQFNSMNDFWKLADISIRSFDMDFGIMKYLPVRNTKMMETFPLTGRYAGVMNAVDIYGDLVLDETTAPVPFPKLNGVIAGILEHFKISIRDNDLARDPDLEQLYMFGVNSNGYYRFPQFTTTGFQTFMTTIEDGKYVFTSGSPHGIKDQSYVLIKAHLRPLAAEQQLTDLVLQVTVEDEYSISFDITPVVESLSSGYTNFINVHLPYYAGIIIEQTRFHLPEIKCAEFLHEVERLLGCKVFVDESSKSCRILDLNSVLKSTDVIDISPFAGEISDQALGKQEGFSLSFEDPADDERWSARVKEITEMLVVKDPVATYASLPMTGNSNNDLRLVQDENCLYRYYYINFLKKEGWEFYSENFLKYVEGEGKYEISTKFSPVLFEKENSFLFARVEKAGKVLQINESANDDFRLFFDRGMSGYRVDGVLHVYPLLNNDISDGLGNKVGDLALRWDGEYGLYNKRYRKWIDLMVNRYREETRFINWPSWMMNSFPWWKKHRVNHTHYLIKSIDVEILQSGDIKCKDTVLVPV